MLNFLLSSNAKDPETRRKSYWLNIIFVGLLVLNIIEILTTIIALNISGIITLAIMFLLIFCLYMLSKQGYITIGTTGLITVVLGAVIATTFLKPEAGAISNITTPFYMVIAICIAGAFLSARYIIITVLFSCMIASWQYLSGLPYLEATRKSYPNEIIQLIITTCVIFLGAGLFSWLASKLLSIALVEVQGQNNLLTLHSLQQGEIKNLVSENLGNLAIKLNYVTERQVTGIAQQTDSIIDVVSVVTQLHRTADNLAERAREIKEVSKETINSVSKERQMIIRSREAVQRNRDQIQEVISGTNILNTVTSNISAFVNNIRDLAGEVHLLSLNARIEAAGAGEMGHRFSVVAEEVKELAQSANAIVNQIQKLMGELSHVSTVMLNSTENSIEIANEVEELTAEVLESQQMVSDSVLKTSDLVDLIFMAMTEQTTATARITKTMEGISSIANTTNQDSFELGKVVKELTTSASTLNIAVAANL